MEPEKFEDVLEDIRRVVEEKGFILNHEIESLIGDDFSPESIVSLYDRLSEEKIDYFDSPEKAKIKELERLIGQQTVTISMLKKIQNLPDD